MLQPNQTNQCAAPPHVCPHRAGSSPPPLSAAATVFAPLDDAVEAFLANNTEALNDPVSTACILHFERAANTLGSVP